MKYKEPKLKKMSRRNLALSAIKYLEEETGFHSSNIRFGNGYLVDTYKDSICWFCFKEIPGYTFALWHKDECNPAAFGPDFENAELILFTQADLTRDKFKPSRSSLKTPMFRYTWKDNNKDYWEENWNDCMGASMIKFIKEHKYIAFYIQSFSEWLPWEYVSGWTAFKEYYRTKFYYWNQKRKENITDKKVSKEVVKRLKNIEGCRFTLSKYNNCYPSLHLFVYFKSKIDKDILLYNNEMDYLEDKYWKELSINYVEKASEFNKFSKYRIKNDGKGETLIWKKLK